MTDRTASERLPRGVRAEEVDVAEAVLARELAQGPRRPRDVKAVAADACGYALPDGVWQAAKRRLGVRATQLGPDVWSWALPVANVEDELAAWLDTPQGRFAVYVAERDRLADGPPGEQLQLGG